MIATPAPSFCAAHRRIQAIRVVEVGNEVAVEAEIVVCGIGQTIRTEPLIAEEAWEYDECLAEGICKVRRALRRLNFSGAEIAAALEA